MSAAKSIAVMDGLEALTRGGLARARIGVRKGILEPLSTRFETAFEAASSQDDQAALKTLLNFFGPDALEDLGGDDVETVIAETMTQSAIIGRQAGSK